MAMSGRLSVEANPMPIRRLSVSNRPTARATRIPRAAAANGGVRQVRFGFEVRYPIQTASAYRRIAFGFYPSAGRGAGSVSRNAVVGAMAGA